MKLGVQDNASSDLQGHAPAGNWNRVVTNTNIKKRDEHGMLIFRYSRMLISVITAANFRVLVRTCLTGF